MLGFLQGFIRYNWTGDREYLFACQFKIVVFSLVRIVYFYFMFIGFQII